MSEPIETAAGALLREQGARFDGFALHLDDLDEPEDRAAALGEARAALASLAQHRDDLVHVHAEHEPVPCSHAKAGGPVLRWWLCEACGWESPHRREVLLTSEAHGHAMDAVLAYLTGEPS